MGRAIRSIGCAVAVLTALGTSTLTARVGPDVPEPSEFVKCLAVCGSMGITCGLFKADTADKCLIVFRGCVDGCSLE